MKLVKADYVGLVDGIWTKVAIELEDGRKGVILFENDGRDIEIESEDFTYHELADPLFNSDENMSILESAIAEGTRAYEELPLAGGEDQYF